MLVDWEISHFHVILPHPGSIHYSKDKEVPQITSFPANHFSLCFILICWVNQWDSFLLRVDYRHHCKPKRRVITGLTSDPAPETTELSRLCHRWLFQSPPNFWHLSINNAAQCLFYFGLLLSYHVSCMDETIGETWAWKYFLLDLVTPTCKISNNTDTL